MRKLLLVVVYLLLFFCIHGETLNPQRSYKRRMCWGYMKLLQCDTAQKFTSQAWYITNCKCLPVFLWILTPVTYKYNWYLSYIPLHPLYPCTIFYLIKTYLAHSLLQVACSHPPWEHCWWRHCCWCTSCNALSLTVSFSLPVFLFLSKKKSKAKRLRSQSSFLKQKQKILIPRWLSTQIP